MLLSCSSLCSFTIQPLVATKTQPRMYHQKTTGHPTSHSQAKSFRFRIFQDEGSLLLQSFINGIFRAFPMAILHIFINGHLPASHGFPSSFHTIWSTSSKASLSSTDISSPSERQAWFRQAVSNGFFTNLVINLWKIYILSIPCFWGEFMDSVFSTGKLVFVIQY